MLPKRPSYRFHPSMPENPLGDRVTNIHVSNLHCGSCVLTIQHALSRLEPQPLSVEVSVVSQTVTVNHLRALSLDAIQSAIVDAGFDVPQLHDVEPGPSKRRQTHLQQCTLCQKEHASSLVHSPSTCASPKSAFRLTLSVGGMSCSSCTNTITRALSEIPGISDVVVSLLESSATALLERTELSDAAQESVEDCGFEAHIMSVEPIADVTSGPHPTSRTVSLRVGGMFCKYVFSRKSIFLYSLAYPEIVPLKRWPH
jgi:Cu+-exporting ATPase